MEFRGLRGIVATLPRESVGSGAVREMVKPGK
jgi:hypothetical protein